MRQIKLVLFRLDYLLGAAIMACQMLNLQSMTSVFFYATFFVSAALWICAVIDVFDRIDCIALLIIILAFIHVVMNGIAAGAEFSFGYMKKYIMFCCSVVFLAAIRKISLDKASFRFLELLFLGIGAFMLYMYVFRGHRMHILNGQYTRYLTFRFSNPNLTALFLACMIMFLEIAGFKETRPAMKLILLLAAVMEAVFLYQTESRNALLAIVVFTALSVVFFIKKRNLKFKKWFLLFAAVMPLIFAVVYMRLVNTEGFMKIFSFVVGEGKNLDSRVRIWSPAFRYFEQSPIFGAYYQISGGRGVSQLHNTHVDILASYGVTVLVLVCAFLYCLMREKQTNISASTQDSSLLGFVCAIMLGLGEAALFSGGLGVYLFFGVFLALTDEEKPAEG